MQMAPIGCALRALLLLFSLTLLPPAFVSLIYEDGQLGRLAVMLGAALLGSAVLSLLLPDKAYGIRNRDGFVVVAVGWFAASALGAIPFMVGLHLNVFDALFESVSGYTATGATVLVGLDRLAPSMLFYRQEISWLGGIGAIVLGVALLPMLRVGGMQLYEADAPSPVKEGRVAQRIAGTVRTLVLLYVWMTAACAVAYWLAGMTAFDAIAHGLSTLATAAFSTHDASFAYFRSPAIDAVAVVFMLLAAIGFSVHFAAWRTLRPRPYLANPEARMLLGVSVVLIVSVAFALILTHVKARAPAALGSAAFAVASLVTNTGFRSEDFSAWPLGLPLLLSFVSIMGGCAGSTSGGIKVFRCILAGKETWAQARRIIRPQALTTIKLDARVVPAPVVEGVRAFFIIYLCVFVLSGVLLMMDGMDQVTAFAAVAACLNNLGPGLGRVAANFAGVTAEGKLLLSIVMLLGRLEIFTLLALCTPAIWKELRPGSVAP